MQGDTRWSKTKSEKAVSGFVPQVSENCFETHHKVWHVLIKKKIFDVSITL